MWIRLYKSCSQQPFTEASTLNIKVYGEEVEQVSKFKYLGAIISADGYLDKELTARLTNNKIRIYKAATVLTILCYSSFYQCDYDGLLSTVNAHKVDRETNSKQLL